MSNISVNCSIYESLLNDATDCCRTSTEEGLQRLEDAAEFAVLCYPGMLSDHRLESVLNRIAGTHIAPLKMPRTLSKQRRVLHVASMVFNTGGHTRVLRSWMQQDTNSESYLFVTRQSARLSNAMEQSLVRSCKQIVFSPIAPPLDTARALRAAIQAIAPQIIVLHHHPDDISPILALSIGGLPPVILYNHSDHTFGVGPSVADAYVDFREVASTYSVEKRLARMSTVLPFPLAGSASVATTAERAQSRAILGCPKDSIVLMTMASAYKFSRFKQFNFFEQFGDFLSSRSDVHLYVIGASTKDAEANLVTKLAENIHCLGTIEEPKSLLPAADYFIEPFPLGSCLAAFDIVRHGAFPVFSYGCAELYNAGTKALFPRTVASTGASSVEEYFGNLGIEISTGEAKRLLDPDVRSAIKESVSPNWQRQLERLYAGVISREHQVGMPEKRVIVDDANACQYAEFCFGDPVRAIIDVHAQTRKASVAEMARKYETSSSFRIGRKVIWLPWQLRKMLKWRRGVTGE